MDYVFQWGEAFQEVPYLLGWWMEPRIKTRRANGAARRAPMRTAYDLKKT